MKRLVVLIDGTWNDEHQSDLTNVAKLDPGKTPIIKARGSSGTEQIVFYHSGVGTDGSLLERILGGRSALASSVSCTTPMPSWPTNLLPATRFTFSASP